MPGTDERSARDARQALYEQDWTQQAIGDELGISITTVFNVLRRLGVVKRPRGAAIAVGVSRYWDSEKGRQERARRISKDPPAERICEWCGKRFEISAKKARQSPGRFCSREHKGKAGSSAATMKALRDGLQQWRARLAELTAATGLRDLDHVIATLRRADLPRSQPALSGHIAKGWLKPMPNELGGPVHRCRDRGVRRVSPGRG
jgi:hypothetical protein